MVWCEQFIGKDSMCHPWKVFIVQNNSRYILLNGIESMLKISYSYMDNIYLELKACLDNLYYPY